MAKRIITISREFGSGGRFIGEEVAKKLGIAYYDKDIIGQIAEKSGFSKEYIKENAELSPKKGLFGYAFASEKYGIDLGMMKDYDEKRMGSILYSIAMATSYASDFDKITKPYEIYEAQAKVMRQLVSEGPCIFLGRCAAEILKDKTELLNVFIYSSDQHAKTERIIRVDGVAQSNAVTELHKRDVQRGNYYHYFSKKTWGDRNHYDLCLNTAELGYEKAAEILAAAAK